ncbi:MAG: hypothetical protein IIA12_02030 [Proteobacteria bacterium]|nr:hypothetical protein [Pseudomonadota bacterium]
MAFDNTITHADLDDDTQVFVEGLDFDSRGSDPDLAVDGMSESILSRLLGLFGGGRTRH